jgi:hypothetical protein
MLLDKATGLADRFASDNQRLRRLLKDVEAGGYAAISMLKVCPWCRAYRANNYADGARKEKHAERGTNDEPHRLSCPAFTVNGDVK